MPLSPNLETSSKSIYVRIECDEFTAGMTLSQQSNGMYKIIEAAPKLKRKFIMSSLITVDMIREKCKREGWILEISFPSVKGEE